MSKSLLEITGIGELNDEIVACRKCPRLVAYREAVARERKRAFREWDYWGKPVPGFGDPHAGLYILGLAPAAHGANRTGRMFTGDRSGDFLYRALHRVGFANKPISVRRGDGLKLQDAYIGAAIRCAPPANKPLPSELANCKPFFEREITLVKPRAILALGAIAMKAYLGMLKSDGAIARFAEFPFSHGAAYQSPGSLPRLFLSYHPSQQNTFTGKLTPGMLLSVLRAIRKYLDQPATKTLAPRNS
jgi:uracil-DNA glycosylase family 4